MIDKIVNFVSQFDRKNILINCSDELIYLPVFAVRLNRETIFKAKIFPLTFLEANVTLLLPRVIGRHFEKALDVPEKCFGRR